MHVTLTQSPAVNYRYRVILPNKRALDFGVRQGQNDYTVHRDPMLMRHQLAERGGKIPYDVRMETDPHEIHRSMLYVDQSTREDWDDPHSRDFWDRWLLMSYPTVHQAKLFMTMRKGMLFMPTSDNFFYC